MLTRSGWLTSHPMAQGRSRCRELHAVHYLAPLSTGALYQEPGTDYLERRHDPVVEAKRLARRIEALGFDVSLIEKAA
ncbi:MAG: hypothetical protein ACYCSF_00775 [Acidimicrobiales bacterium]